METVEIVCRCKDCDNYDPNGKEQNTGYCYYWSYEQGETPNTVEAHGFGSNAVLATHK